jgi:hypothetical protein
MRTVAEHRLKEAQEVAELIKEVAELIDRAGDLPGVLRRVHQLSRSAKKKEAECP